MQVLSSQMEFGRISAHNSDAPIIVTLQLDADAHALLSEMRDRYFPAHINYLTAHMTLFHNLPGNRHEDILKGAAETAKDQQAFLMTASCPLKLGRGVAIRIESESLLALRRDLARAYAPWLSGQDRQKFRPHVTVQNKVSPAEASHLFEHLKATFAPTTVTAEGLQFWAYEKGPWRPLGALPFRSADTSAS